MQKNVDIAMDALRCLFSARITLSNLSGTEYTLGAKGCDQDIMGAVIALTERENCPVRPTYLQYFQSVAYFAIDHLEQQNINAAIFLVNKAIAASKSERPHIEEINFILSLQPDCLEKEIASRRTLESLKLLLKNICETNVPHTLGKSECDAFLKRIEQKLALL